MHLDMSKAEMNVASQRIWIVFHKFHNEVLVAGVTPAIAVDAADQHLTVAIFSSGRLQ